MSHLQGYSTKSKSFYHIDYIILIICFLSLFTHCTRLLIIGSLVRVRLGEPAFSMPFIVFPHYQISKFANLLPFD